MKNRTVTVCMSTLLFATGVASALAPDDAPPPAAGQHDAKIQKLEERLKNRFAKADANGDGHLTREEAQQGMPRVYQHFDAIDTTKKGFVTVDEIESFIAASANSRHQ